MSEAAPTLVILAAGLGTRYRGMKQLEPVGPGGGTLIDYTVFDALRYGFARIVFVIRPDMDREFRARIVDRYRDKARIECVHQPLDACPAGGMRPLGTGHAVLCAAEAVRGPFGVANADDFYGDEAMSMLGRFLREGNAGDAEGDGISTHALVGFALRDTLSASGVVNRAIVQTTRDGELRDIREVLGIRRQGADGYYVDVAGWRQMISGDTCTSMNLWGFSLDVLTHLRAGFLEFLHSPAARGGGEFYLLSAVRAAVRAGRARVRVLRSEGAWCGITHPEDRAHVMRTLVALTDEGRYPARLWS